MKRLLLLLSFIPLISLAQAPQGVGYQGVATDVNGIELINQSISIRASVLSGSANGTIEWDEIHATTTDTFGLFSLTIGQGTSTGNGAQTSFADISWGNNTHFLKIEMDVNGGSNYSFMGTNQMMSVPYSLYSKTATTAQNVDPTDELQNLSISGDTLFISDGNHIIIPGLSLINNLIIYGCMDYTACNYDPTATVDDGSCTYIDSLNLSAALWLMSWDGNCDGSSEYMYVVSFDSNGTGILIAADSSNAWNITTWSLNDSCAFSFSIATYNFPWMNYSNGSFSGTQGADCVTMIQCNGTLGCMDTTACNYDASANCDDGSCLTYYGCMDSTANNYNPYATCDDSSCVFVSLAIGDNYQGGIIFWLDGNGGGLIAAPTDQSTGAEWGCYGTTISGAYGTAIGTGNQNTIDILAECTTPGTAADICANLTLGGYSDWFLPSKDEFNEMSLNLYLQGNGGFTNTHYWTSLQVSNGNALSQNFSTGNGNSSTPNNKSNAYYVRAIRAF